ncbi:MAG TPA: hypothetical protein PLN85_02575 [archaeon]|nr:hypothetical protein [archaeon]
MAFFSRPNLDDVQFKQLSGTTLTLSGKTIFNNTTGLILTDDNDNKIPIVVTGASNNKVLTYYDGKIVLMSGGSGGGGVYYNSSPTTCTVGGLNCGTDIYGCEISKILECIVAPVLMPTLTPNSYTFTEKSSTKLYQEVGSVISSICVCSIYNRGSVTPSYGGTSYRTGIPRCYKYDYYCPSCNCYYNICTCVTNSFVNTPKLNNFPISHCCVNRIRGTVYYCEGEPPHYSNGCDISGCTCPAGSLTSCINKIGVYPYFWGVSNHTGSFSSNSCYQNCLINNASGCCVCPTNGNVVVDNYNSSENRIWLAIPNCGGCLKTKWQGGNSLENKGNIPSETGLFDNNSVVCNVCISSPNSYWSNVPYTFYISSYPTSINYSMTFS